MPSGPSAHDALVAKLATMSAAVVLGLKKSSPATAASSLLSRRLAMRVWPVENTEGSTLSNGMVGAATNRSAAQAARTTGHSARLPASITTTCTLAAAMPAMARNRPASRSDAKEAGEAEVARVLVNGACDTLYDVRYCDTLTDARMVMPCARASSTKAAYRSGPLPTSPASNSGSSSPEYTTPTAAHLCLRHTSTSAVASMYAGATERAKLGYAAGAERADALAPNDTTGSAARAGVGRLATASNVAIAAPLLCPASTPITLGVAFTCSTASASRSAGASAACAPPTPPSVVSGYGTMTRETLQPARGASAALFTRSTTSSSAASRPVDGWYSVACSPSGRCASSGSASTSGYGNGAMVMLGSRPSSSGSTVMFTASTEAPRNA